MQPIIAIIGRTAVGKSAIQTILGSDSGYNRVVSITTRPPRPNEVDGVDYVFVNDERFDMLRDSRGFYEETSYEVDGELYRYAFVKGSFAKDKVNVVVINPRGLEQLMTYPEIKERLVVIILTSNNKDRLIRYLTREGATTEVLKRYSDRQDQDDVDFDRDNLKFLKPLTDIGRCYVLKNIGIDVVEFFRTLNKVKRIIKYHKGEKK